jgi:hypothetical protein
MPVIKELPFLEQLTQQRIIDVYCGVKLHPIGLLRTLDFAGAVRPELNAVAW